jgi:hypothetical protein
MLIETDLKTKQIQTVDPIISPQMTINNSEFSEIKNSFSYTQKYLKNTF